MARFNTAAVGTVTENLAGGVAYSVNPKFEFVSILLTSFVQDQFYRKADDTLARLALLMPKVGYDFAAKAAVFARNNYGMRSITHYTAAQIAKNVSNASWTKKFFTQVIKRPDDMTEICAAYAALNSGKLVPMQNALKKAIRFKLCGLNEYSLAKYKGEGKEVSMIDLVRLTHAKSPAITKLVKSELKSTETWESKLVSAGQKSESEEELQELKSDAWKDLLTENKLGYLALIRNCRNIIEQAPDCIPLLCERLKNAEAIKKSLVFPFQIWQAGTYAPHRDVLAALGEALELSLENVPKLEGKTVVAMDCSGSMTSGTISNKGKIKVSQIACLFAAVIYKAIPNSKIILFDGKARYVSLNPTDSTLTLGAMLHHMCTGGSTDFSSIFKLMDKEQFDRVIILSDMQGWVQGAAGPFNTWKAKSGSKPYLYSWDLCGYGTSQLPESNVFLMAGFSDKCFDTMKMLETDKNALVNEIEKISFKD